MWGNWLTFSLSSFLLLGKNFTGGKFSNQAGSKLDKVRGL
jgi:hypothetical protein